MGKIKRQFVILGALAGMLLCGPAFADSVSGQFTLDGKALKPTQVAAFRMRDQYRPREFETHVMLTTKAVDREAIRTSIDPYSTAINDAAVMNDDYIAVSIKANGEASLNVHAGGTQYIDSSGKIMGEQGSITATCATNTTARVACTVKSIKAVKSMDGPAWTIDVSFDSEVLSRAAGKPVASGGGEPGQAFLALVAAVGGTDLGKIVALLSKKEAESYQADYRSAEENLESAKSMLGMLLPKKPKVTGGEFWSDQRAVLEVEGVPYDGAKMLYMVDMQKENGRWVFESSQVAGMLR